MEDNQNLETAATRQMSRDPSVGNTPVRCEENTSGELREAEGLLQAWGEDRYEVGKELGRGSMGAVYEARDVNIRRSVAMKLATGVGAIDPAQAIRFVEEAQITGQLEHSAIVPVYELGLNADHHVYYTMKHVRGRTLGDVVEKIRQGRYSTIREFSLMRLLRIFLRVCDAVSFAHARHVIHRDLKPENIMIEGFGEVFVMDWGLAKVLTPAEETRTRLRRKRGTPDSSAILRKRIESVRDDLGAGTSLTLNDEIMGSPSFMAPEQIEGEVDDIGPLADVYALGGILYTILTLKAPLDDEKNVREILWKTVRGEIPPPSAVVSAGKGRARRGGRAGRGRLSHLPDGRVPEALSAVAMKAMAVDPLARYQSVTDLQEDIEAYMSGFATSAEEAGFFRQLALLVRRHRIQFASAVAVLAVIGSLVTTTYTRNARSERRARAALKRLRSSAPAFADQARLLITRQKMEEALGRAIHAAELTPDCADYHALQGDVLQTLERFADSAIAYQRAVRLDPENRHAATNLEVSRHFLDRQSRQLVTPEMLTKELVKELLRQERRDEAAYLKGQEAGDLTVAMWKLKASYLPEGWELSRPANGDGLDIRLDSCKDKGGIKTVPEHLKAVRGGGLVLDGTAISDLSPLAGTRLQRLSARRTRVESLSALTGMPLESLNLERCPRVEDFGPLASLRELCVLHLPAQAVEKDLSCLKDTTAFPRLREFRIDGVGGSTKADAKAFWGEVETKRQQWETAMAGKPPRPPAPDVYLSDLDPIRKEQHGDMRRDLSFDQKPLRIRKERFGRGIGTHAPSELAYYLKSDYRRFVACVGIDDEVAGRKGKAASVTFKVLADNQTLFESGVLTAKDKRVDIEVAIPAGCSELVLLVHPTSDGNSFDHADWGHAGFITAE